MAAIGAPFGILTRERLLGAALQFTTVHLFFAGVLLLVLLAGSGNFWRYVNVVWLQFFGYISYGLYLIHMLIFRLWDSLTRGPLPQLEPRDYRFDLVLLRFGAVLVVATLVSFLSRKYYEEKFLRLKDKLQPNLSTSAFGETPVLH
jgi:peptidoglycan/LPS O-acetylase OafA/YrhL